MILHLAFAKLRPITISPSPCKGADIKSVLNEKKWLRKLLHLTDHWVAQNFWELCFELNSDIFVLISFSGYEFPSLSVLFANDQIDGQVGNSALMFKQEWI